MNAWDCLDGASEEEKRLTAACLVALRPVIKGAATALVLGAMSRAAAIVGTSCADDGHEALVVRAMASVVWALTLPRGEGEAPVGNPWALPPGQVLS